MTQKIINGDSRSILQSLQPESVHCCVTSPPYYGLRNYGTDGEIWGGDDKCEHEWQTVHPPGQRTSDTNPGPLQNEGNKNRESLTSNTCIKCGAWRGELGLEPTPEMYVQHLAEICRGIKRVLRKDGVFWLNIGDSYCGSGVGHKDTGKAVYEGSDYDSAASVRVKMVGIKPKDLIGIPWLVAFALRADGWYLRADLPWIKRNAMPSSVRDRPASSIEHVFLLSKSQKYYYDHIATMQPSAEKTAARYAYPLKIYGNKVSGNDRNDFGRDARPDAFKKQDNVGNNTYTGFNARYKAGRERYENRVTEPGMNAQNYGHCGDRADGLRFMRDSDFFFKTWQGLLHNEDGEPMALVVNPRPYKGAHFACFPVQLVEPMILAGTSEKGVCPVCGAPWVRDIVKGEFHNQSWGGEHVKGQEAVGGVGSTSCLKSGGTHDIITTGWHSSCKCGIAPVSTDMCGIPATVLDPFSGSASTGVACNWRNRNFIGIEIKPDYYKLGEKRLQENK